MKLYYKIETGYGSEEHIPIDADELEKAYGLFLLGGRAVFRLGAVDSKYIHAIVPDWHRIMGWAHDWKLGPDDFNELSDKGIDLKARELQNKIQEKVQYLIANKKENLIGTNTEIPELDKPVQRIGEMRSMKDLLPPKE